MSPGDVLTLLLVVFVPTAALWAIFIARTGSPTGRRRPRIGIPRALRPGQPDEVLEGPRLMRIQVGGVTFVVLTVVTMAFYWLPEASRQTGFQERFDEESLHRGELIFKPPAALPEEAGAAEFKELEEGVALGMACANCHRLDGEPNPIPFNNPRTGAPIRWMAPPLNTVFTRWDEEVIRFTIERGRPGTPMPAWGVEYGGPMTDMMVNDIMAYLRSLPENQDLNNDLPANATGQQIFEARCAVCHAPDGSGREGGQTMVDDATGEEVPIWYPGLALWKGDARHLDEDQHYLTIVNGRRFAFMPQFGEAPAQGIPVPPIPLTDAQIRAVMEYERTL